MPVDIIPIDITVEITKEKLTMSEYTPPINDMTFLLNDVFEGKGLGEFDIDMVSAILEEAGKVASNVLAPLNKVGDIEGSTLENGAVRTATGFKQAYKEYCEGGWNSVPFPEEFGGQELPWSIAFPIQEMWQAANMSFGLCPLLNQGATETILSHGSDEQKAKYLPNMVSGIWTGTMNLTEPQAGSDLGAIKTKAVKQDNGEYLISGQKIFITYGEHDMSDNIIHLVLARCEGAPDGSKGISLFIVPKILEDNSKNDVKCVSIEHKMGINASPTCTMSFGDDGGAIGYLVGEENKGLGYMFTMMNNARLCVGLQGVAIADRAMQHAIEYAQERVQGNSIETGKSAHISEHPDVQRMINTMHALVTAGRSMAYEAALFIDQENEEYIDLLTPIVKSYCTDMAQEVTSTAIQIFGGMGFIEETGAALFARDARILPIYEGTNGIQALDLAFRKTLKTNASIILSYFEENNDIINGNQQLKDSVDLTKEATNKLLSMQPNEIASIATPYINGVGYIIGGISIEKRKSSLSKVSDKDFKTAQEDIVETYMLHILPRVRSELFVIMNS